MSNRLTGIAASNGIAIAKAYLLVDPDLSFDRQSVDDPDHEIKRLRDSFEESKQDLEVIKQRALATLGPDEADVFEAHITILNDPELIGAIEQKIRDEQQNVESAVKDVTDSFISMFEQMTDNPYMQERAGDVRDVTKRVLAHLLGVQLPSPAMVDSQSIVVAHDLTPSDTVQLDRDYVKGFITDIGGRTSHSAIMSRTLEIPAVVGVERVTKQVHDGDLLIVDGIHGKVVVNPTHQEVEQYRQMASQFEQEQEHWLLLKDADTQSADGRHVDIAANIGTPDDLSGVINNGGEAVGLFRSEFLYMNATQLPTEDEQFEAYKRVLAGMNNRQVVIRTMDIGGDKHLPYLPLPEEMNPFLGYRAIRISLDRQAIFRTQLRALLRASNYGKLAIMFPMIATVDEFNQARSILDEERTKMVQAGLSVADNIEVGMMMEIPAAVMIADKLAKYVDFFSIGTNDLIQYSFAADRGNEHVSYLYQPYNPALLRLIKRVIDCAHEEGKRVGMCGEMAGDQVAVPLLLGMGLDEFSMSATSMLQTRSLINRLDTTQLQSLVSQALDAETNEEVVELVHRFETKPHVV